MKKLLLLSLATGAIVLGLTWGNVTVAGGSPFGSPQPPPKETKDPAQKREYIEQLKKTKNHEQYRRESIKQQRESNRQSRGRRGR